MFSGLTRLGTLDLHTNQLGALPAGLFSGLTSLHTLRLDDNELSALPVAMFFGLTRLHTLHLDNNDLATLPARLFSGLENLGTLSVAENQLSALPDGLFLGLGSLSEIDFSLNSTDPLELTAELVRRDPADGEGGFAVAVTTSHGWPGKMKGVLSATNATLLDIETVKTEVMLTSGDGDSAPARFEWVDESTDAKICIGTQNGDVGSIESLAATFDGLEVMASPSCLIVPPPQPAIPTVKITSPQVSAREGQQAKITFVVSPKATESFDLRFTTRVDGNDDTVDAIEGKDYTTPGPVKVSKDSLGGTIFIPIVNDTEIDEGIHEYFVVELSAPSEGDPYRLDPTRFTATVIINDGICDRAEAVQDAIIGKLDGSPSCYDVTGDELASITGKLDIARTSTPVTLRAGEFRGLSNVQTLSLLHVNLSPGLPVGLFEGLDSLFSLAMCDNKISSLNAGVFSGLKNLTSLDLDNNSIPSLPADLFADTPDLKHLRMYSNEIASLEGNVLRGATKLTHLELFKNKLSELPVGLFVGLSNLSIVSLHSNKVDPLEIPVIITDKGNGNFAVKVAQGAPFDISASFDITGGSAEASSATILAGSTESLPIKLEWGTGNVTITPVKPTWANGPISANNLRGLILTKGLPLEISSQEDQ